MKFLLFSALITGTSAIADVRMREQVLSKVRGAKTPERFARALNKDVPCGEIFDTLTAQEARDVVEEAWAPLLGPAESFFFRFTMLPRLTRGVQVRKACGRCSDFPDRGVPGICHEDDYGYDTTVSGLLILPMKQDATGLVRGTHIGSIHMHGSMGGAQNAPSVQWQDPNLSFYPYGTIGVFFTSSTTSISIIPDYLGYAHSAGEVFRGFLTRQFYVSSTVPLLWSTDALLQEETGCEVSLADSVVISGYSEGGYAAAAVADAMGEIDIEVIRVFVGGAPLRVSSVQLAHTIRLLNTALTEDVEIPSDASVETQDGETVDLESTGITQEDIETVIRGLAAIIGSAFSSTYEDLANFQQGQDLLGADYRDDIVAAVNGGGDIFFIGQTIPSNNSLSIIEPAIRVEFQESIIDNNDDDPCATPVEGVNDLLCQALKDQDLATVLESADYPVTVCHSTEDDVIPPANLPDFSANSNLESSEVIGNHIIAGGLCLFEVLDYYLLPANVATRPRTSKSCSAAAEPTAAPVGQGGVMPVEDQTSSAATTSLWFAFATAALVAAAF